MRILKLSLALLKRYAILQNRRNKKMEKKKETDKNIMTERLEVSYVYDPVSRSLECEAIYNGLKDGFCAVFDEHPTHKTMHEFINGFMQFLLEKSDQVSEQ